MIQSKSASENKKGVKGRVHYHHDTKKIDAKLSKGSMYRTSKGAGRYKGRSWSNGKLQFIGSGGKNLYFTLAEWIDGGNSHENIDKDLGKKMEHQVQSRQKDRLAQATEGRIPFRSIYIDEMGRELVFEGVHPEYGVKTRDAGLARGVVYYPASKMADFEIAEYTLTDERLAELYPDMGRKKAKTK